MVRSVLQHGAPGVIFLLSFKPPDTSSETFGCRNLRFICRLRNHVKCIMQTRLAFISSHDKTEKQYWFDWVLPSNVALIGITLMSVLRSKAKLWKHVWCFIAFVVCFKIWDVSKYTKAGFFLQPCNVIQYFHFTTYKLQPTLVLYWMLYYPLVL